MMDVINSTYSVSVFSLMIPRIVSISSIMCLRLFPSIQVGCGSGIGITA